MNLIMDFFNKDMIQPEFYTTFDKSWFHYLFLILLFVGMFFSVKLMRKMSNKEIKKTLLIFSLILIAITGSLKNTISKAFLIISAAVSLLIFFISK